MRVVARQVDWAQRPAKLALVAVRGQTFLTVGREYEVEALSIFQGMTLVLVIDDVDWPNWYPMWLFDVVDARSAADWICTPTSEEPSLIIGPDFIARDMASYCAMVDNEPKAQAALRHRIEQRAAAAAIQRLVDDQLASITDAGMREAVRAFLVAPKCEERQWDYGQPGERLACWVVARFPMTNTAIVYCESGFGPDFGWGIVTLSDERMGPDGAWHFSLERAFCNTHEGARWTATGRDAP